MKKTFKTIVLTTVLVAISGSVFADFQLNKDKDEATVDVKANIPEMVTITTPTAMPEMVFNGKDGMTVDTNFCIASNLEKKNVQLTVSSNQTGADFSLVKDGKNPAKNKFLPFTLSYKSTNGKAIDITKDKKVPVDGAQWLSQCTKTPNTGSTLTVKVNNANAQHVFAGNYNATLTLTVTTK